MSMTIKETLTSRLTYHQGRLAKHKSNFRERQLRIASDLTEDRLMSGKNLVIHAADLMGLETLIEAETLVIQELYLLGARCLILLASHFLLAFEMSRC